MLRLLKFFLGNVCMVAGGGLLVTCGADMLAALSHPAHGMALTDLAGAAGGGGILGAGIDLCGWMRRAPQPQRLEATAHGQARPATEPEAQSAARGNAGRRAAHDQEFAL